eukprot:1123885-Amorphochlora_amoeboformis.AAC.1
MSPFQVSDQPIQPPSQPQYQQNVQYVYEVPGYGFFSASAPVDPAVMQMSNQMANVQMEVNRAAQSIHRALCRSWYASCSGKYTIELSIASPAPIPQ